MNWQPLTTLPQIDLLIQRSHLVPCLIFKHSTRCNISSIARYRLEQDWQFGGEEVEPYYLDLIAYRHISNAVSERFQVYHESPQVLLIWKGECIYDASHLDISVEDLKVREI